MIWQQARRMMDERLRPAVTNYRATGIAAAMMQRFFDDNAISKEVFSRTAEQELLKTLELYNVIDRVMHGAETEKYICTLRDGDITIWAPPDMNKEEIEADIYPGVGIVWYAVVIGIALISAAIVTIEVLDYKTREKDREMQRQMIKTAKEVAALPAQQRDAFNDFLQANADTYNATKTETGSGLLGMLVGKKTGGALAIALVVGIAAWAIGQTAPTLQAITQKKKSIPALGNGEEDQDHRTLGM